MRAAGRAVEELVEDAHVRGPALGALPDAGGQREDRVQAGEDRIEGTRGPLGDPQRGDQRAARAKIETQAPEPASGERPGELESALRLGEVDPRVDRVARPVHHRHSAGRRKWAEESESRDQRWTVQLLLHGRVGHFSFSRTREKGPRSSLPALGPAPVTVVYFWQGEFRGLHRRRFQTVAAPPPERRRRVPGATEPGARPGARAT